MSAQWTRRAALPALLLICAIPYITRAESWDAYHDYASASALLNALAADHPERCRLASLGLSTLGKDLWALKAAAPPDATEPRARVALLGGFYGDRPVATEILLRLAEELVRAPESDPRLQAILSTTEVWILPLLNPDGREALSPGNAHLVILERNFPDAVEDPSNTCAGREPETCALLNFFSQNAVGLAAILESGDLVVSYPQFSPWPNHLPLTPDDAVFRELALTYARANPALRASAEYPEGVATGAEVQVMRGSVVDWLYNWPGAKAIRVAFSEVKAPRAQELARLWSENREPLLRLLERARGAGLAGGLSVGATGAPAPRGRLRVAGRDSVQGWRLDAEAQSATGQYHVVLDPGVFDLLFEAEGFPPAGAENVEITTGTLRRFDPGFYLCAEAGDVDGDGRVTPRDAQWASEAARGERALAPERRVCADLCPPGGDGRITEQDAAAIFRLYLSGSAACE